MSELRSARGGPGDEPGLPRRLALAIAAVLVAAAAAIAIGLGVERAPAPAWDGILFFAVLVVLAEAFAADLTRRTKTSITVVPVMAAALLFGVLGSIITAFAFGLSAGARARSPLHRIAFNIGCALLSAEAARWSAQLLGQGTVLQGPAESYAAPIAAAGLVYYAVNHVLLCTVRALAESRPALDIWREYYGWLWPYYPALALLAAISAHGYGLLGLTGSLGVLAVAACLHVGVRQHARWVAGRLETTGS